MLMFFVYINCRVKFKNSYISSKIGWGFKWKILKEFLSGKKVSCFIWKRVGKINFNGCLIELYNCEIFCWYLNVVVVLFGILFLVILIFF